ncbi:MAG: flippase [Oscillospiraceae bacterium]|nr:flippase [Oscillospiraceae bacterium]
MNRFQHNLTWVFLGNLLHAVFQFLLNLLAARAFSVEDYGLLNYGAAFVAFFTSLGTLGFSGVITKYFADDPGRAGQYLGTALVSRAGFALIAMALIQLALPGAEPELRLLLLCQSAAILFSAGDGIVHWYRFRGKAKQAVLVRLSAFGLSALWRLWAIYGAKSLTLYAAGVSLETLVYLAALTAPCRRELGLRFKVGTLKGMLSQSYPFITSAILSTVYAQTDKLMLGTMLSREAVGLYSVAVTLAGAISILPSALIEGFRPEILLRKAEGDSLWKHRLRQLYGLVFWVSTAYSLCVTLFAGPLVGLLYGESYAGAVPALRIVVWYTAFSYFGSVNNLAFVAQGKTKWVQLLTLTGAVGNVALNALLIPAMGVRGAALASLVTQFAANFLLLALLPPLRENFRFLLEGIFLRREKTS